MRIFGHDVAIFPSRLSVATRCANSIINGDVAAIDKAERLVASRRETLKTDRVNQATFLRDAIAAQSARVAKAESRRADEVLSISERFDRAIAALERAIQKLRDECSKRLAQIAALHAKVSGREAADAADAAALLASLESETKSAE